MTGSETCASLEYQRGVYDERVRAVQEIDALLRHVMAIARSLDGAPAGVRKLAEAAGIARAGALVASGRSHADYAIGISADGLEADV